IFFVFLFKGSGKPNVVFILVDALRPDRLGCYGGPEKNSLHIDNLARKGILFENAVSQAVWTKPSVTSIFISRYLRSHQVNKYEESFQVGGADNVLPDDAVTLAEVLKKNGYATSAVVGNLFIKKGFGLDQGFDDYICLEALEDDSLITAAAVQMVNKNRGKPFFLYLHYMAPHSPYTPPKSFLENVRQEKKGNIDFRDKHQDFFESQNLTENDLKELRARYDSEIRYVDEEIGKFLSFLEENKLKGKSLIVLMADHGEALGERGAFGHSHLLNTVVRVPLIFYGPRIKKSRSIPNIVELIDVSPTVLSYLNLEVPPSFQGINILETQKTFGFSEKWSEGKYHRTKIRSLTHSFIIHDDGSLELYDLQTDPFERNPLELNHSVHKDVFMNVYRIFQRLPRQQLVSTPLSKETIEKLRSLGYVK
ncbi:MAG: sulfatase, partial [Candidatus Aminicenantes bacterium]|nr:sulfatase [Candidatus Aminicenantes bacterium]